MTTICSQVGQSSKTESEGETIMKITFKKTFTNEIIIVLLYKIFEKIKKILMVFKNFFELEKFL